VIKKKKKFSEELGLTLIEILIGIVITTLMMGAMYTSYNVVNKSYSQVSAKANISKTSRDLVSMLMRDIRMAGFKYYAGSQTIKQFKENSEDCKGVIVLPKTSYFVFDNGFTDETKSHNPIVIKRKLLGNSKITHETPGNLNPPILDNAAANWSKDNGLTTDQKKKLSTDLCCDQIEIVYEDFNQNDDTNPFKKYRVTYFAEKTGGGNDARYGVFKSVEMWDQSRVAGGDCTWPTTSTNGWITDKKGGDGKPLCPECIKRELIRDYVVDMEFIPFDQYGVIIKSSSSGEYPRPKPELGDINIRDRLYDIRGVDIRLTFRTKENFFTRNISNKRKPKELLSDRKPDGQNFPGADDKDLYLRDSVIVTVNTRNIGKGMF